MKTAFFNPLFCAFSQLVAVLALLLSSGLLSPANALSACSSDKVAAPSGVLERFIDADCASCWANSSLPAPRKNQAVLDWIVPSPRGEDAVLSSAATLDASARLQNTGLAWPASQTNAQNSSQTSNTMPSFASGLRLRVANGLPVNGYMGSSIELLPNPSRKLAARTGTDLLATLVLVETLPAGSEGSNVERNLVRNVQTVVWKPREQLARTANKNAKAFFESRPMSIPQGSNPDRLRVVGWVQNAQGQLLATAQSRCEN